MNQENRITCIVVDDDLIDRLTTLALVRKYPQIVVLGDFDSPQRALEFAREKMPDVIMMDIDMPGMSGLILREKLLQVPVCIFVTNYPEYALSGFDLEAFDFLLKPIADERFYKMMTRLLEYFDVRSKADLLTHTLGADAVEIREGTRQIRLPLHDIIYLEAMKDYTGVVTAKRKYMMLESIGSLLQERIFVQFIRIHRSYAVQKAFIRQYNTHEVVLHNQITLPVGRRFKDAIKGLI